VFALKISFSLSVSLSHTHPFCYFEGWLDLERIELSKFNFGICRKAVPRQPKAHTIILQSGTIQPQCVFAQAMYENSTLYTHTHTEYHPDIIILISLISTFANNSKQQAASHTIFIHRLVCLFTCLFVCLLAEKYNCLKHNQ
jgi:hypothetical protein